MTSHRRGLVARWELGRPAVRALAAVAAIVSLVAAFLAWQARPRVEPAGPTTGVVAPDAVGVNQPDAGVNPSGAGASVGVSAGAVLVVAVSGRVRRPGLVQLPPGARVGDALAAAGGPLPGTDMTLVNLARRVADGELIVIGVTPPPGVQLGGEPVNPAGPAPPPATALVNLNTATSEQLQTLPGVGPVLAERILAFRVQRGGFTAVSQLRQVSGIGDARFAELKDRVTV
jgi:competence protein ComEA